MKSNYLVCYDIADERRLARVYKYLKEKGVHIQYSVFHCQLTWQELKQLKLDLNDIINESEDDIRIYPLPQDIKVFVLGCGDRVPDGVMIFLR
ncbi:MAG TPA: CRISPR-associated endonuclease Cas2 [Syntrophorhabdaceae bacterium]|nr:CRISPR-associated endonuclease Cas2 [Syntrophorhabdaceae bacterium]HPU30372.1 CRISPR-associated endonuclease Cas2 [Syntrophorhabdaceae bacterium]